MGKMELLNLAGHSSWVSSLSFAPDASHLLTADFNGQIRLWDTSTGEMIISVGNTPGDRQQRGLVCRGSIRRFRGQRSIGPHLGHS